MNFEDYTTYRDYYDGFIVNFEYLRENIYYSPFERSKILFHDGDGSHLGYTSNSVYLFWDESLIFVI